MTTDRGWWAEFRRRPWEPWPVWAERHDAKLFLAATLLILVF